MKWSTNIFFPKKIKQLNRCPIRFGVYQSPPTVIIDTGENSSSKFSGANVDALLMFSDVLNFTLSLMEIQEGGGVIYKNKSATGDIKRAMDNTVDFIFAMVQQDRSEALSATRHVFSDKIILVVPPPFLIDPMKKIFLPFALTSWISIGMVGLFALCIVKLIKFAPSVVHDYVIGKNVRGSTLNVCNIAIGGAQQILPRGSFPRFLVANFLIFTLIIRTLYQGEVFKLLKTDVRTVQLNTIEDYVEHKFTFYFHQAFVARLQGTKIMESSKQRTSDTTSEAFGTIVIHQQERKKEKKFEPLHTEATKGGERRECEVESEERITVARGCFEDQAKEVPNKEDKYEITSVPGLIVGSTNNKTPSICFFCGVKSHQRGIKDLSTRGFPASQLVVSSCREGSDWLGLSEEIWSNSTTKPDESVDNSERKKVVIADWERTKKRTDTSWLEHLQLGYEDTDDFM
ncbi:hypothetical protein HA402_011119 [Bradysia odoriphaga]|nr:hypothetical protein HA402_011119 [Bradysia odoriphaga]